MTESEMAAFQQVKPTTSADQQWAESDRGQALLAAIHTAIDAESAIDTRRGPARAKRRRRARRLWVGSFAAVVVGTSGATAYAVITHSRKPTTSHQVLCNQTASLHSHAAGFPMADDDRATAIEVCSTQWTRAWPTTPKPTSFAACVYPEAKNQAGGGLFVIPADPGVTNDASCLAIGADTIG